MNPFIGKRLRNAPFGRPSETSASVVKPGRKAPVPEILQTPSEAYNPEDEIDPLTPLCPIPLPLNAPKFPEALLPIYVISIRRERFEALKQRMGPWAPLIRRWPSYHGGRLNDPAEHRRWIADGRLPAGISSLRKGEVGCYHSHITAWEHILASGLESAVILEDDCDISSASSFEPLFKALDQIKANKLRYDLLYLAHTLRTKNTRMVAPNVSKPTQCQCLFAYLITKSGIEKMLPHLKPYTTPIDVVTVNLANRGIIQHLAVEPSLFQQVDERVSDTSRIR